MLRSARLTIRLLVAAALIAGVVALPSGASALSDQPPTPTLIERAIENGEISSGRGALYLAYALGSPAQLPPEFRSDSPWHGTVAGLRIQRTLASMKPGPLRSAIVAALTPQVQAAGPGDPGLGDCFVSAAPMPDTRQTTHFYIEYNAATLGGGLNIQDYAESLEGAWNKEITRFDWATPPVYTPNPAPNRKYHVRIDELSPVLYGFVSNGGSHAGSVGNNPNTAWHDRDADASCMVLNRDYSNFPGTPRKALDATTAHEFNHSIQFGYGALSGPNAPDDVFVEGGATWMEDEVYDGSNDNYNYLWPTFQDDMGEYEDSPYPYWVTFRGITERYGAGVAGGGENVMQDFWEITSRNQGSNLGAMQKALARRNTNLGAAYHAYAIAVKFNRKCGGGYAYPYCFQEGPQYVGAAGPTEPHGTISSRGGSHSGEIPDNYALNWVVLPRANTYSVTLRNSSGGGRMRGTVVCDTGWTLRRIAFPRTVGARSTTKIGRFDSRGCVSAVAVVTNIQQTATNPRQSAARSYSLSTGQPTS